MYIGEQESAELRHFFRTAGPGVHDQWPRMTKPASGAPQTASVTDWWAAQGGALRLEYEITFVHLQHEGTVKMPS